MQYATGQETASIKENQVFSESEISFYPNPTKDVVNVTNTSGELTKLSIFNILGDEVLSKQITKTETELAIDKLPSGVYIVAFYQGDKTITERLIKE